MFAMAYLISFDDFTATRVLLVLCHMSKQEMEDEGLSQMIQADRGKIIWHARNLSMSKPKRGGNGRLDMRAIIIICPGTQLSNYKQVLYGHFLIITISCPNTPHLNIKIGIT